MTLKTEDGEILDGVVDLLFAEERRLWLVDFKTDAELGDGARYAAQLALYAGALQSATGLVVQSLLVRV